MTKLKYRSLGERLTRFQLEVSNKKGRLVSDNEIASMGKFNSMSWGRWKRDLSLPTGKNLVLLANLVGPDVYDYANQPRLMPSDPVLRYVAENWHNLNNDAIRQIEGIVKENTDPNNELEYST